MIRVGERAHGRLSGAEGGDEPLTVRTRNRAVEPREQNEHGRVHAHHLEGGRVAERHDREALAGYGVRVQDGGVAVAGQHHLAHGLAGDGQALEHDAHEVEILDLGALQKGDLDEAAVGRQSRDIFLQIGAADHVEDHVRALFAGLRLHFGDEILLAVIDRYIGPELSAKLNLFRGARCG